MVSLSSSPSSQHSWYTQQKLVGNDPGQIKNTAQFQTSEEQSV